MWLEARLERIADEFWEALPYGSAPFPRALESVASLALPVAIRELPQLSLGSARRWLLARGVTHSLEGQDRPLRGCLVAYGGYGFVLVDGSDPLDEMRFTVAHELAHFMLDYQEPRRRAIEALGAEIIPVLDSARIPTRIERLHAILSAAPIGLHTNMMERTTRGAYASRLTLPAEEQADRLALQLLATAADAWATLVALPEVGGESNSELQERYSTALCERYGLPSVQAQAYAEWLLKKNGRGPGVREWLK